MELIIKEGKPPVKAETPLVEKYEMKGALYGTRNAETTETTDRTDNSSD